MPPRPTKENQRRRKNAQAHFEWMAEAYPDEIKRAIDKSVIYGIPDKMPGEVSSRRQKMVTKQFFMPTDSLGAAIWAKKQFDMDKIGILNFADFVLPGGWFFEGSGAQEESLCHESILANILKSKGLESYYAYNEQDINRKLFYNRAIFTPDVLFIRAGKEYHFSVLTCAAPHWGKAKEDFGVSKEEDSAVLRSRVAFMKGVMEDAVVEVGKDKKETPVKVWVLGAWGCGAFKHDPKELAKLFTSEYFGETYTRAVVYAVPGKMSDANPAAFKSVVDEINNKQNRVLKNALLDWQQEKDAAKTQKRIKEADSAIKKIEKELAERTVLGI